MRARLHARSSHTGVYRRPVTLSPLHPFTPSFLVLLASTLVFLCALCVSAVPSPSRDQPIRNPKSAIPNPQSPIPDPAWRPALPGYRFRFPRDHAAHPGFQTEWWYYTGHMRTRDGREYGFELTFFRVGIQRPPAARSAWTLRDLYFAHFTVTDIRGAEFHVAEAVGRGVLGMSGARTDRCAVWINDWRAELIGDRHHLTAHGPRRAATNDQRPTTNVKWSMHQGGALDIGHWTLDIPPSLVVRRSSFVAAQIRHSADIAIDLWLRSAKPPVIHGKDGIDQKAAGIGRASHYYSLTRLRGDGTLTIDGRREPVTVQAWMDHEFGSNQLGADQAGWDWFSLQLDDGRELMLYVLRLKNGRIEPFSNGTLVEPDGSSQNIPLAAFRIQPTGSWRSPRSGATYPSAWRLHLPKHRIDLRVTPTVKDQELVTSGPPKVIYWEGSVRASGTAAGRPVTGIGYVELTGYARGSKPAI